MIGSKECCRFGEEKEREKNEIRRYTVLTFCVTKRMMPR